MRPLLWTDRRAAACAACLLTWAVSVELGTSRRASRVAASASEANETVVDTSTSRLFDAAAVVAIVGGFAASLTATGASVRARRTSYVVGLGLLGGSGLLSAFSRRHLGRFHRSSLTVHAGHELVETGPYRRVRHPLYAATVGTFLGLGAVLGNWFSFGLAGLPTLALVHRIRVEEHMLDGVFGSQYERYREGTYRLLPGVW